MKSNTPPTEVMAFCCQDCGGSSWHLYLSQEEKGTYLLVSCADEACIEKKRIDLNVSSPREMIVHLDFDITGQGFDSPGVISSSVIN